LDIRFLGRVPYDEGLALQRELAEARKGGTVPDTLLLLEHEPVVTLGRNTGDASVLGSAAVFRARGVELITSDRGGDATFHGPGQVVAYPIIDLQPDRKDIRRYVRSLEQVMMGTLARYGIHGFGRADAPGVWLDQPSRKIGAIGARVSRWVTHHGLALNVNVDLSYFDLIIPCGIRGSGVTSMEKELGRRLSMMEVMECLAETFLREFGRESVEFK